MRSGMAAVARIENRVLLEGLLTSVCVCVCVCVCVDSESEATEGLGNIAEIVLTEDRMRSSS